MGVVPFGFQFSRQFAVVVIPGDLVSSSALMKLNVSLRAT